MLPAWHRAYMAFRFGDGLTHALIPLMPLLRYDMPLWTVPAIIAAMNLVTVPSTFMWGHLMDKHRGRGRRRLAIGGFAMSAVAVAVMTVAPPFPVFVLAAAAYTAFGVATAPAASVLLLESIAPPDWAKATGKMAQRTGYSYLAGIMVTTVAGLLGRLDLLLVFIAGTAATLLAMLIARATIEPAVGHPLPKKPAPFSMEAVRATQRRFERPLWFPSRLRFAPTLKGVRLANGHPLVFLAGYFLMFAGSAMFFSIYPGILRDTLGLGLGLVLLAQAPSNFATPMVHPWAGHYGTKHGEMAGSRYGAIMRAILMPALAITILFWQSWSYMVLLALHALIGVSFALLQVNGSCLMAKVHRAGRGQGVGNFHAAVSLGGLAGSLMAAAAVALLPLVGVYAILTLLVIVGAMLIAGLRDSQQFVPRNV